MSGYAKRLVGVIIGTLAIGALIGLYIGFYLLQAPPSASATTTAQGDQLYLATVAASKGTDAHPNWVSYYSVDANDSHWVHATTYTVPAHTVVHVTIFQFDGQSGLRNEFLGQPTGTIGPMLVNGKPTAAIDPATASHLFAIPQIGLFVPLEGIADDAKNPCANAPCPLSTDHFTVSFSFRTPGKGLYRWQCFVPCAAGFIQGFGGPMQTVGYMDGFIKVV